MKRCLSAFLAFAMLLSLFAGLELRVEAASYRYNTGKRGEVCTELSSYAQAYYTGSYTYANLSKLSKSSLRSTLNTLVNKNKKDFVYADLREYLPYTDADYSNKNNLILFYCNQPAPSEWDNGRTWNREHMWPDSLGGSALEGDLHSMRPTDPTLNSRRSNNQYGESHSGKTATASDTNGGAVGGYYGGDYFEPLDVSKGDCARVILYDYVAQTSEDVISEVFESVDILLKWCALDPVDEFEMSRNDSAQSIQNNRNPFVDYPELAWILMGRSVPADLVTPGGGVTTSYTITASSNNTSYGTVSLSGNTITATPKTGYYVSGYTIVSGSATVTQDGNIFTVQPNSDCQIRINFAKKTTVIVSFNDGTSSINTYAGEAVTLPAGKGAEGYHFIGWTTQSLKDSTQMPTYYAAGQSYTATSNVTLYALYSYIKGGTGVGWFLVTEDSQLYSGAQLVLVSATKGKIAGAMGSSVLSSLDQSLSSDLSTISALSSGALVLTLGGKKDSWTFANEDGRLLGVTEVKKLAWDNGTTTWTVSVSEGNATITSTDSACGRFLYNSGSPRFTTYVSNTTTSMVLPQLYMQGSGTVYYTTETVAACDHSSMSYTNAMSATCTESGNVAHYTCKTCGKYFADAKAQTALTEAQLVIAPLGHAAGSYDKDTSYHWQICTRCGQRCTDKQSHTWDQGTQTLAPTEDKEGLKTYTCTACSATYTESIPALGPKLTVKFSVPQGVEPVTSLYGYAGDGVTLPTISGTPGSEYTFLGWTAQAVNNSTTVGTYYKAGATLTLTESMTLKALFSYSVGNGTASWKLVESTSALKVGSQVVIACSKVGVVAGALSGQVLGYASATFSSDKSKITSMPSGAQIFTLGGKSGAWTFANDSGKLLGATAQKKLAWGSGMTTWTISISSGSATITNRTSAYGKIMYNVLSPRFTTYTSSLLAYTPELYIRTAGSTTYYHTEFPSAVEEPTVDTSITINHTLNLASDISVIYAIRRELLDSYDSFYLECSLPQYEGNTLKGSRNVELQPVVNGSYYYFTLTGVTAVDMNDMITATVHMEKDGKAYLSESEEYSVATYAYTQLDKSSASEKLKTLCANLLRYGAAAQTYKEHRTDALADSAMTATHKAYLADLDGVKFNSNNETLSDLSSPKIQWVGKALLLDSKVTLRYVFDASSYTGSVSDLSLKIAYTDYLGEEQTVILTGAQAYGTTAGRYSFDFDGLLAAELRSVLSAAVYAGNTRLSQTMVYSVDTYGNGKTGSLDTLCRALMAYSDAALSYFS